MTSAPVGVAILVRVDRTLVAGDEHVIGRVALVPDLECASSLDRGATPWPISPGTSLPQQVAAGVRAMAVRVERVQVRTRYVVAGSSSKTS